MAECARRSQPAFYFLTYLLHPTNKATNNNKNDIIVKYDLGVIVTEKIILPSGIMRSRMPYFVYPYSSIPSITSQLNLQL